MFSSKLGSILTNLFFFSGFACLGIGVIERIVRSFGYTILQGRFSAGRLVEFAAILAIFAMMLLLSQIRRELALRWPGIGGTDDEPQ